MILTPGDAKKSKAGRKPVNAIGMFRIPILQSLYNLSDEQFEFPVCDRISFTRFLEVAYVHFGPFNGK
jgi:IS5 family transposase